MTIGNDLEHRLDSWMQQDANLPDDLGEVLTKLPETPQRRHRWSFHFDDMTWRTRTMFSATRVAAAIAIFTLGASLTFVGVSLGPDQDAAVAPSAEIPAAEVIAHVTGEMTAAETRDEGTATYTPRAMEHRGVVQDYDVVSSDPRLSGQLSLRLGYDTIFGVPGTSAFAGIGRIENDEGAWEGPSRGVGYPDTNDTYTQVVLTGSGAYEGLTAVLDTNNATNQLVYEFEGSIFPGALPALPAGVIEGAGWSESDAVGGDDIAYVTGVAADANDGERGTTTYTSRAIEERDASHAADVSASDPRLSGRLSTSHGYDEIFGVPGTAAMAGVQRLENDGGAWEGPFRGVSYPGTNDMHYQAVMSGSGAYEGLTAVVRADNARNQHDFEFEAVIFPGALPELP